MKTLAFSMVAWAVLSGHALAQVATLPEKLSLDEALRLAEARNPTLAAAREMEAVAEASGVAARPRPNPACSFDSEGYALSNGSGAFFNEQEVAIRIDQEVETAGRRGLRARAADLSVQAARSALQDEVRKLQFEVRRAYFQVVLARADHEAATSALEEIDKVIALNRARFEQGDISGVDLRRLQVERLKFADDVFSAELAARNARSALLALLNTGRLDQAFETTEPLAVPPASSGPAPGASGATARPSQGDAVALRVQALANRPDLAAARQEESRAATETDLQRALRTPNVTVGAGYRRDFGSNGVVFGVTVPLPVFGRNPGGVERAAAERRLAANRVAAAETAVALDVQQAINAVEISQARVGYIEREHLTTARETRDIVSASYRAGASTLIDFLDAQRAFRETLRTYNRALYDHRLSLFQLVAALGLPGPGPAAARPAGEEPR
jgi:cobalt-zinc-cadmium efflux system outer membrane protein